MGRKTDKKVYKIIFGTQIIILSGGQKEAGSFG